MKDKEKQIKICENCKIKENCLELMKQGEQQIINIRKEVAEKIYNYVERYIMEDDEVELMVKEWFKEEFGCEIKE